MKSGLQRRLRMYPAPPEAEHSTLPPEAGVQRNNRYVLATAWALGPHGCGSRRPASLYQSDQTAQQVKRSTR
jgi:hypothetical protein